MLREFGEPFECRDLGVFLGTFPKDRLSAAAQDTGNPNVKANSKGDWLFEGYLIIPVAERTLGVRKCVTNDAQLRDL